MRRNNQPAKSHRSASKRKTGGKVDRSAEPKAKTALDQNDRKELIQILRYAASCADEVATYAATSEGEVPLAASDDDSDKVIAAKSTRIFHLLSSLARELEKLQRGETPGAVLKLTRQSGKPHNALASKTQIIIGSAVAVLVEDLGFKTQKQAIEAVEDLVKTSGFEDFEPKSVARWTREAKKIERVAKFKHPQAVHNELLRLRLSLAKRGTKRATGKELSAADVLTAARRMIEKAHK